MSNRATSHVLWRRVCYSSAYQNQPHRPCLQPHPSQGWRWGCSLPSGEAESMTKWVCSSFVISPGFPWEVAFLDDGELWNSLSTKQHKLKSKKELSSWELLEYWWNIASCYLIHSSGIEKISLRDDLDQWCPTIFSMKSTFKSQKIYRPADKGTYIWEMHQENKCLIVEAIPFEGIWMLAITTFSTCCPRADLLLSLCVSVALLGLSSPLDWRPHRGKVG